MPKQKAFEEQVLDLIDQQESQYERLLSAEMGPPPDADLQGDTRKLKLWNQKHPQITDELGVWAETAAMVEQLILDKKVDPQHAEVAMRELATHRIYPFRKAVYESAGPDPKDWMREAARMNRLSQKGAEYGE